MARTAMDRAKKIKIYSLYSQGVTCLQLSERFGLTARHIGTIVRKMRDVNGKD